MPKRLYEHVVLSTRRGVRAARAQHDVLSANVWSFSAFDLGGARKLPVTREGLQL